MQRTAVNPWPWSTKLGYNQAELVTTPTRTLYCSGQTAMSPDGHPQHPDDMAAQLTLALDNLEATLTEADMTLTNLIRLTIYTTDVDLLFQHYSLLTTRLAAANASPPTTMLGVTRLALPTLVIELEATAVA